MTSYTNDPVAAGTPTFDITTETEPSGTLLAGFSQFGLAGLTAVDYLVDHLDLEKTGHVTTDSLPTITPFENGRPRHHTRFFSRPDLDVTVLVGELVVPQLAARPVSDTVVDWMGDNGVDEVAVLSGVPVPHGPDQHRTFYIATDDFHERRLADADVPAMGTGFLDGVNAELLSRGIDSPLAAGVFVTPAHAQAPDVEAAIRLLDTVSDVYDLDVDTGPLESFAAEVAQHYEDLAERVENVEEDQRPEDRMYV
ncbi:proteasome assembly chaperone family protein [Halospeciosus flavus]|uniref:Proteasome assembly chaperone family protein n=1 Tax=Halospeciosus flavus TaxID=3032283 RepID=A0ABD5Z906_9EURY|nr:PAC2 family protein [Halospeciosus flavus]